MDIGLPPTQSLHNLAPASLRANSASYRNDSENYSNDIVSFSGKGSDEYRNTLRLLANQLGITEAAAYRILRRVAQSGELADLGSLKRISQEIIESKAKGSLINRTTLEKTLNQASEEKNPTRDLKALDSSSKAKFDLLSSKATQLGSEIAKRGLDSIKFESPTRTLRTEDIYSSLTRSPKEFASWLVNNKSAFVSLKYYPEITNLLIALQSPRLDLSPSLMAEIAKLLSNLIKLKQGKSSTESLEEEDLETRNKKVLQEAYEKQSETVGDVKDSTRTVEINPLRDFLIEAERFAEEEVANLWSLTLKKEKEIEQKILEQIKSLRIGS